MKILIYSDLHISKSSSILPNYSENKNYTYRQNMIIKTGEWLASIIAKYEPDLIVNLGDTFDQHTISSYDINVASKFFNYLSQAIKKLNKNIPHYVLLGNHEMINGEFNAISLLNNIDGIEVIDEPKTINKLAFLPYCNHKEVTEFPEGAVLFSHQDIQDSYIRTDFKLPHGLANEELTKYKYVFNGHIHMYSENKNIINIGSCVTHNFNDCEEAPKCIIFDSQKLEILKEYNTNCPLFRKIRIQNEKQLKEYIQNLDLSYKYILNIFCPSYLKENIKNLIDENKDLIIASRVRLIFDENNFNNNSDELTFEAPEIKESFIKFLENVELKNNLSEYKKIILGEEA